MKEKPYEFRKRLLKVHKENLRDWSRKVNDNEFLIETGHVINIVGELTEVAKTAACDFADFLRTSMGVSCRVAENEESCEINVALAENEGIDLKEAKGYKGFMIETNAKCINIYANDERGIGQALFYLEFLMECEKAPVCEFGIIRKKPVFAPRMVHSGYGLDEYPDEYLQKIAHEGRDAILVFTKGVNEIPDGYLNFNDLIRRAAKYGLDVYAYSYLVSNMSPESPEAEAFYDNTYGRLFKECPGLKGVTLVGESVEFPSKDPNVAPGRYFETAKDGIPADKPSSGWYPCYDYPIWLNLLKKIIRKYNKDADIVFWSYNWGRQSEEVRVKLIESLPTDISLQATFEMFEPVQYGKSMGVCADYTISFSGPGAYFKSEAIAAKKRGIKLYSMTNTGGQTWDFGVIPYIPVPYQWIRRFDAMRKAHKDWGLCGLMETHHYGFTPSFISRLSNFAFSEPYEDMDKLCAKILKAEFGDKNFDKINEALLVWSEAIKYGCPTNIDQYGPFRVGPSYPFCLSATINVPSDKKAMFGNRIVSPSLSNGCSINTSPLMLRLPDELERHEKMYALLTEGIEKLMQLPDKNEETQRLLNIGRFMANTVVTAINVKKFHICKCRLFSAESTNDFKEQLDRIENIINDEMKNVEATIPIVEADSRLGWEPSMLYITDKEHLEWKKRQLSYVLNTELSSYRLSLSNMPDYHKN